jgi:tripartite-type tricarboxylate transporter receptor subunit TctC
MRTPLVCLAIGLVSLFAAIDRPVQAKDYPTRPVRIIVPYPSDVDVLARIIAQKLSERLGDQFYVENLAGAGGVTGTGKAATAPPDGHTILFIAPDFVVSPLLHAKVPYDLSKSFTPVTLVAMSSAVLFSVHPSVPRKT